MTKLYYEYYRHWKSLAQLKPQNHFGTTIILMCIFAGVLSGPDSSHAAEIPASIKTLCQGNEIIITLLFVILLLSIGKAGGLVLLQIIKKVFGKGGEVTVNFGSDRDLMAQDRESMAGDRAAMVHYSESIDPTKCTAHCAESERSIRNQNDIHELWVALKEDRKESKEDRKAMFVKLDDIKAGVIELQVNMARLHANNGG